MSTGIVMFPARDFAPKAFTRITRSSESSGRLVNVDIPQTEVGVPVMQVIGRRRVPDANTLWVGNLQPLTETTVDASVVTDENGVTTTYTTTTTAVIGYFADIHMGICLGPDVHLLGIYADEIQVWSGDVGPARSTFDISANRTFLSGVSVAFSGGSYSQTAEPLITEPDYPGYVGVATILLQNIRLDLPMANISFEVSRTVNPLALSAPNNVLDSDVNVASAIVEVMTNNWGSGNTDIANIDTVSFTAAALTLAAEGNFCSLKIGRETSITAVIKALQDQAGMIVYQSSETGKIACSLVRPEAIDYTDQTKRFTPNNIISLQSYQKTGWKDAVNQAVGLYTSRLAKYAEATVFLQNPANMNDGKKPVNFSYPYVSNKTLARKLLSRDIAVLLTPLMSFTLLTNRDGADRQPGDIIFVNWPKYNFSNLPMLVLSVRKQPIDQNTVTMTVRQIAVSSDLPYYDEADEPTAPFDLTAQAITATRVLSAPFYFAQKVPFFYPNNNLQYDLAFPLFLPTPANAAQTAFHVLKDGTAEATCLNAGFPTCGKLLGAMGLYDGFDDGIITTVTIDNVVNPINLVSYGLAGVQTGMVLMFIGDEILSFETATDLGGGSWELGNVHRALIDTVFEAHADLSDVHIVGVNNNFVGKPTEYPTGSPQFKMISSTLIDRGFYAGQPSNSFLTSAFNPAVNRLMAPARPHNTKINGGTRSSTPVAITVGASVTVSWASRNRLSFFPQLMADGSSYQSTQQHRVWHDIGGTLTALSGLIYANVANTATFTMPSVGLGAGFIYVESSWDATIPGGFANKKSLYRDKLPVIVS
jgi:hypothetical protein